MRAPFDSAKPAVLTLLLVAAVAVFTVTAQQVASVASPPVFVPDTSHANEPMPPGVIAWDATQKTADATNGQDFAHFAFSFTNVATRAKVMLVTNYSYTTNFTIVTNKIFERIISWKKYQSIPNVTTNSQAATVTNGLVPETVAVLNVHPSCGCTTAEVPSGTWLLPPGTNGVIRVNVNLAGKSGMVFKTVTVTTDHGRVDLMLRINIHPAPPARPMTEAERAAGVAAAKVDRQAVFRGDCASCHAKNVHGKYGPELYALVCGICHEANPRATMVPDLHNLKDPTSEEFWRAWITSGKPGTLMPAFSTPQGGPLDDFQIASLAAYLNTTIPSKVRPAIK
jgi:mono/diheme cytochrome c family protein